MGATGSSRRDKPRVVRLNAPADTDVDVDMLATFSLGTGEAYHVQHYMPPHFPLLPKLTTAYIETCRRTWTLIQTAGPPMMRQYGRPGIVLFYEEFFLRLFERDTTIAKVFANAKKRGEVLVSAIQFILSSKADTKEEIAAVANRCRFLGHRHRTFPKVRPHHFATYTTTCIEVVMFWLGDLASWEVGVAWSNTVGFILQHLLEPYLYRRTDPYEHYQNTTIAAVREVLESKVDATEDDHSAGTTTKVTPSKSVQIKAATAWNAIRRTSFGKKPTLASTAIDKLVQKEYERRKSSTKSMNIPSP
ncbi:Aste57867_5049 [Aphanomyces stellatus]|uniref:Aste57867_5049 protein n=1 Tax=Aphanomyces stellatus TaxID=120398 RepID=A0A485KE25_9STRA|nr:hypothetical protein As57867_005036 [Aphanomyces stellatus]VFT82130.1 Aste57867_5049 [Aphanomyces stellatus]